MPLLLLALAVATRLDARVETPLMAGWLFHRGEAAGGEAIDLDMTAWAPVTLPHKFNGGDGETGGGYPARARTSSFRLTSRSRKQGLDQTAGS